MLWQEQNWPAIQRMDKSIPVVVPLGSLEQHGHHLPLFVDSFQVQRIADEVEQRMRELVVVLPTQWLGCSDHHRDFPGTLSLPSALYGQVIERLATGILAAGFRRILFLNGHGGNEAPAAAALAELVGKNDDADAAHLALASWWQIAGDAISSQKLAMKTPGISHACEYETSLMLVIRPDLVTPATNAAPVLEGPWYSSEYGGKVQLFHRYKRLTAAGSMGSPSEATAEKGQRLLKATVDQVCALLADLVKWPLLPPVGPK
jgi:creatinine amidohydrolase